MQAFLARMCHTLEQQFGNGNRQTDVSNPDMQSGIRRDKSQQSTSISRKTWAKSPGSSDENVSNTNGAGHNPQKQSGICTTQKRERSSNNAANADWWSVESRVRRVDDGLSNKLLKDQIKARLFGLGNAQVPLAAAMAWKILTQDLTLKES